ncbi:MAG: DNA-binding transcriptional repressor AcrR [Firmicutes bacterium ADurb.BinA205]|nr:MAG: DNA-binding transcriptional repressor AcrR [Firmicutes bacterium ADurb.BinA205]
MSTPDKSIDPRLLASAEAEFNKNGFIKAELKTICENAGITTGALYKRYKGKEELFCAVVDGIVSELNDFVENRSDIDYSALSNAEIIASWTMTYESFIPMFRLLYDNRITFVLLIDKAAGTRYENFNHEFVTKLSYAYEKFYDEAKNVALLKRMSQERSSMSLSHHTGPVCASPLSIRCHGKNRGALQSHVQIFQLERCHSAERRR